MILYAFDLEFSFIQFKKWEFGFLKTWTVFTYIQTVSISSLWSSDF